MPQFLEKVNSIFEILLTFHLKKRRIVVCSKDSRQSVSPAEENDWSKHVLGRRVLAFLYLSMHQGALQMNEKSFSGALFTFLFAFAGFVSHAIAIKVGTNISPVIVAFVYAAPLLIDAIEDYVHLSAYNYSQFILDGTTIIMGSIYLLAVLVLFALQVGVPNFQIQGMWKEILDIILIAPAAIFIVRTFYAVKLKWVQNKNVAKVYYVFENEKRR